VARLSDEEKARRALTRRRKAAVEAEQRASRVEARQREWREKGMRLTYAEAVAGEPCRGCGRPIIDGLGAWPPPQDRTEAERAAAEDAEAEFRRRHRECDAISWTVGGSRAVHCGYCCPPPPLSDATLRRVAAILGNVTRPDPAELDTWRMILTCDHLVEVTMHRTVSQPSMTTRCEQCAQTRGVVEAEKLPPTEARRLAEERRLAEALADAQRQVDRYDRQAANARRRVQALEQDIRALDG